MHFNGKINARHCLWSFLEKKGMPTCCSILDLDLDTIVATECWVVQSEGRTGIVQYRSGEIRLCRLGERRNRLLRAGLPDNLANQFQSEAPSFAVSILIVCLFHSSTNLGYKQAFQDALDDRQSSWDTRPRFPIQEKAK